MADYRITIEDLDPTWSEWHSGRLPDVHGVPAGSGHWWTDRHGLRIEGYEDGGSCGGCGWRPDDPRTTSTPTTDHVWRPGSNSGSNRGG